MRPILLAALLGLGLALGAAAAEPARPYASRRVSTPEDLAALRQVVDEFRDAIAAKSGRRLSALVLHSRILFTSPGDQAAVDKVRQADAHFDGVGVGGFGGFAHYVSTTPDVVREDFHNVQITQDGPCAWVMFDYEFYANDKLRNYGVEHWQLRKTDGRWKIFSVIWTTYLPAAN